MHTRKRPCRRLARPRSGAASGQGIKAKYLIFNTFLVTREILAGPAAHRAAHGTRRTAAASAPRTAVVFAQHDWRKATKKSTIIYFRLTFN
jgi:hypothetical protein